VYQAIGVRELSSRSYFECRLSCGEKALTKAGIDFLAAGERGEGVRLRSPRL
jgi:hypothetical protein